MRQEVQVRAHFSIDVDADACTEDIGQAVADMFRTMWCDKVTNCLSSVDLEVTRLHSASFIEEADIYSKDRLTNGTVPYMYRKWTKVSSGG